MGLWSLLVEMEKNRRKSKRTVFLLLKIAKEQEDEK